MTRSGAREREETPIEIESEKEQAMESSSITQPTTPAEAARSLFEGIGRHELDNAEQMWSPDAVDTFVAVGEFRGLDAIVGFFTELLAAFPDMEVETERILSDGSWTTVQWHASGTFTGAPFLGIEATGRRFEGLRAVSVAEWDDQLRIRQNTIYWDGADFARQLGILPPTE
ncbi:MULTISPECIES: ester cyclase [unclassified Streptomyces]|uniref:ester cyclase n=1 Tax=unclassified Streptomyces TaxID=2593676 RepID=UPI002DDBAF92|nr:MULTISPECIES: ester cyclase [unclassified Streptomyces]WSC51664.1 ester cyclase [Streptomyces sp. NBC_01761]WSF82514.1 ester cyclase [Streptomyces sp. NBC_01744]WSJ48965.1 ester cyclase [Streptomyces sp. NBC_01318]